MLKSSIALRLFGITLIFLIIPTFIWLGFFLHKNHTENVLTILYSMQDRCYARASRLEETIGFHQDMLTLLIGELNLTKNETIDPQILRAAFKKSIAIIPSFENLFYIKKTPSGHFSLVASSAFDIDKFIDVSDQLIVTSSLANGKSMTLGFDPDGNPAAFITQTVLDENRSVKGIIGFALTPQKLLFGEQQNEYISSDTDFAIASKNGIIFADQNPEYRMFAGFPLTNEEIRSLINQGVLNPEKVRFNPVAKLINFPPFTSIFEAHLPNLYRIDLYWPIAHSNAVLMIGIDGAVLSLPLYKFIWKPIVIIGSIFVLVVALVWALVKRLSQPFSELLRVVDHISANNLTNTRYQGSILGYEINEIGDAVNYMLDNLAVQVETIKNEPIRQKLITEELQLGHQIQQQLLPQRLPELAGCSLAATAIPALEVGGDFYDVFLSEGRDKLFIVVADGAGKGISACLFALGLRSMFRSFAAHTGDVAATVTKANDLFCRDTLQSAMFATVVMGLFDPSSKTLTYYSAGHPPVLLRNKEGEVEKLESSGIPIGIDKTTALTHKTVQLNSGDILLFYSDGVTEEMNPAGEMYGEARLVNFLNELSLKTPQAALDALLADVKAFSAGAPQHDDITAVMLYVR